MRIGLRYVLASAVVAALALPTLALGQTPTQTSAPTLSESTTSGFPDKAYLVTLPSTKALNTSNVDVTRTGSSSRASASRPRAVTPAARSCSSTRRTA